MEDRKEGMGRFSVPAFGEWDGKVSLPDYSIDFSRIREHRRLSKSRVSLGNEEELLNSFKTNDDQSTQSHKKSSPLHRRQASLNVTRKKISGYFFCNGCLGV